MPGLTRSPVLVARRAELAAARQLVGAVSRGRGSTLLVTGEAGIGKSRLVAEVAALVTGAGLTVLTGHAVPGGGTYRAVAETLAGPLREHPLLLDSPRLRPYWPALRRLIPAWDGADAEPGPDAGLDRAVVLGEGMLALLSELHGGVGCLLVLEDLHWADADTLSLVGYLADALSGAPVLLTLTARDDVRVPGMAQLATHRGSPRCR
ncbi:MAG TPA: ATP-binding protein [Pseudonocardiaceae bacterium]|nr:ATP-binding protein [Pseudonocardiaceae bacterium]